MAVTYSLQPGQPLGTDAAALARVLQHAGVRKDGLIRVTGPAGLTAILWLCRHGYDRAVYVQASRFATVREPADAVLIPHACAASELAGMLRAGDCVREGGVLIVQAPAAPSAGGPDPAAALLSPLGYQVEQRLTDKGRAIYIARRLGLGDFRKAA